MIKVEYGGIYVTKDEETSSMDIDIKILSNGEVKTHLRYDHICRKYTLIGADEK